jgi:hypothetical protein
MNRALYLAGWGYVAIASAVAFRASRPDIYTEPVDLTPAVFAGDAGAWFTSIKPRCNALEVELALQSNPPPSGWEGAGYAASCRAIAGRIEQAREILQRLPSDQQYAAASIVFTIGHPIADMGDDRSAGPIMQLVVEYQPQNYMALYHAGMSLYATGDRAAARRNLEQFLEQYAIDDGWRSNAQEVLRRLRRGDR